MADKLPWPLLTRGRHVPFQSISDSLRPCTDKCQVGICPFATARWRNQ